MSYSIQALIADAVHDTLRRHYPDRYSALCHVHAVVGSNLISIVLGRVYRPVAGLAVVDAGAGHFIRMTDNSAFANPAGGAFHCWIESADPALTEHEIVDLTFRHNHEYAANNGLPWRRAPPPKFLWGPARAVLVKARLDQLPPAFPDGMLWLQETDAGWTWMTRHLAEHMTAYVTLTAHALQRLQALLPPDSPLLATLAPPVVTHARPELAPA
jgi:hypothetical protein